MYYHMYYPKLKPFSSRLRAFHIQFCSDLFMYFLLQSPACPAFLDRLANTVLLGKGSEFGELGDIFFRIIVTAIVVVGETVNYAKVKFVLLTTRALFQIIPGFLAIADVRIAKARKFQFTRIVCCIPTNTAVMKTFNAMIMAVTLSATGGVFGGLETTYATVSVAKKLLLGGCCC